MKLKHLPFEIYGWLYQLLHLKKFAKNFLPDDFSIRVLCYHDVSAGQLEQFEKQIKFLKEEYKIIGPEELRNFFLGRGFLPGTSIFITFDDGSADQYKAAGILNKHGIKTAFFVIPKDIEAGERVTPRPGTKLKPMTWEQIKNLNRLGHVIASHSYSHQNLVQLQPYQIYEELKKSKDILEEKLAGQVDFFAFPYGTVKDISDEAKLIAQELFNFNFTFIPGKNNFETADKTFIKRSGVRANWSLYRIRAVISGFRELF